MVEWLMRGFFLLVAAAIVAWLAEKVYNRSRKAQSMTAVVEQKSWTKFPQTVISVRRDRKDFSIGFRLLEEDRAISFAVPEDVYKALEKGERGILTYQGTAFRSFERPDGTLVRHTYQGKTPDSM